MNRRVCLLGVSVLFLLLTIQVGGIRQNRQRIHGTPAPRHGVVEQQDHKQIAAANNGKAQTAPNRWNKQQASEHHTRSLQQTTDKLRCCTEQDYALRAARSPFRRFRIFIGVFRAIITSRRSWNANARGFPGTEELETWNPFFVEGKALDRGFIE